MGQFERENGNVQLPKMTTIRFVDLGSSNIRKRPPRGTKKVGK